MRGKVVMLLGVLVLLLGTDEVLTQQGGGKKGGGRGGLDPSSFFDKMSGGKEVWIRAETDPRRYAFFDRIAEGLGITNGQITRDQFSQGMLQMKASGFGVGKGKKGGGPPGPGQPGGGPKGGGGPAPGETFDQYAERRFKRLDQNGDNYINTDEARGALRDEFARWDKNKDNLIDFNEYKAFLKDFEERRAAQALQQQYDQGAMPEEEDRRPVVYNASNLPLDKLPPWFVQLDTDKDGQIGLYEWRMAGKPMQEFLAMDRNNDGFLTVEEVLYYEAARAKKEGGSSGTQVVARNGSAPPPAPSISASYPQQSYGPGPPNFKGKKGGKGGGKASGKKGGKGRDRNGGPDY
jgi:hypothetical protein